MFKRSSFLPLLLVLAMLVGGAMLLQQIQRRDANAAVLQDQLKQKEQQTVKLESELASWRQVSAPQGPLLPALRAMQFIKSNDLASLSGLVHPAKGLRFTPYPHVDLKKDKVFTAQQVAGLMSDTTVYQWGVYDGRGNPIELTYSDYHKRFVYDHDFLAAPMLGKNRAIGTGNTIDNVKEAYPAGQFIEFYFPGFDPQYQGIDWSSLKLVFEQQDGTWYLVGIIHGQWTI